MNNNYHFTITPLTYLHVGSGDVIEPIKYIIKDNKLYYLNQSNYIKHLVSLDKKRVYEVLDGSRLNEIAKYFYLKFDPKISDNWIYNYPVEPSVQQEYLKNLDSQNNLNEIYQFIRSSMTEYPIIPGSSLKGSIRTAILSKMAQSSRHLPNSNNKRQVEGELLKVRGDRDRYDIPNDPFKYFKVSDINIAVDNLAVKKLINIKGSSSLPKPDPQKPPMSLEEFTRWQQMNKNKVQQTSEQIDFNLEVVAPTNSSIGKGRIDIHDSFYRANQTVFEQSAGDLNNLRRLIKLLNEHYKNLLTSDSAFFNKPELSLGYKKIVADFTNLKDNECIIRMGKGAGQHSLMFEYSRQLPTTRNLIDKTAMGWCKLSFTL